MIYTQVSTRVGHSLLISADALKPEFAGLGQVRQLAQPPHLFPTIGEQGLYDEEDAGNFGSPDEGRLGSDGASFRAFHWAV